MPVVRWQLVADFLALSVAFYALLHMMRAARAMRIVLGVVGLRALALLALRLNMVVTSWVLDACAILTVLVLLLVFQPELRRAFMQLDSAVNRWPRPATVGAQTSRMVAEAAFALARSQLGALFVITRKDTIGDLLEGGIPLRADPSVELLTAIFQKVSPLHDGAAILTGDQLLKANVVLPLTKRQDIPTFYGTRHRAALGLAERCDALVVAVSEERSQVTLMEDSKIRPMANPEQLAAVLEGLPSPVKKSAAAHWRGIFLQDQGLKFAALGLAGLIWGMSFLASGATVRTVSVPIEFSHVSSGMAIASQSADTLEIVMQGSPWLMDSVNTSKLVGRFDLGGVPPGWHSVHFQQKSLNLPPGIAVGRVTPESIRIQIVPSAGLGQ